MKHTEIISWITDWACHLNESLNSNPINSKENLSSKQILATLKGFFVHVNNNYWGVAQINQCCSLACLKCGKTKIPFMQFVKYGLPDDLNRLFCKEHGYAFFKLIKNLSNTAEKEGIELEKLYEEALTPIYTIEKSLIEKLTPDEQSKQWVVVNWLRKNFYPNKS